MRPPRISRQAFTTHPPRRGQESQLVVRESVSLFHGRQRAPDSASRAGDAGNGKFSARARLIPYRASSALRTRLTIALDPLRLPPTLRRAAADDVASVRRGAARCPWGTTIAPHRARIIHRIVSTWSGVKSSFVRERLGAVPWEASRKSLRRLLRRACVRAARPPFMDFPADGPPRIAMKRRGAPSSKRRRRGNLWLRRGATVDQRRVGQSVEKARAAQLFANGSRIHRECEDRERRPVRVPRTNAD